MMKKAIILGLAAILCCAACQKPQPEPDDKYEVIIDDPEQGQDQHV